MAFLVIDGGKGTTPAGRAYDGRDGAEPVRPSARDVEAEATRRIRQTGFEEWRVRELATGVAMPATLRYVEMQIRFAAEVVSKLEQIPQDFRSDAYWPSI